MKDLMSENRRLARRRWQAELSRTCLKSLDSLPAIRSVGKLFSMSAHTSPDPFDGEAIAAVDLDHTLFDVRSIRPAPCLRQRNHPVPEPSSPPLANLS
jgi:hypothetical protein